MTATRMHDVAGRTAARSAAAPAPGGKTALLLAANGRLAYQVLRCVEAVEAVTRVVVLGSHGESSWPARGLRASRLCAEFIESERRFGDPEFIEQVNRTAMRLPGSVIVPADLAATRFVAGHARNLAAPCVLTPSLPALDQLARKDAFATFCRAAGLPHPTTTVAADEPEVRAILAQRGPSGRAVLKPLNGQGGAGVRIVPTGDLDLHLRYRPVLVQDYLPGTDLSASAFCEGGRVIAFQAYRHLTLRGWRRSLHTGIEFFDAPELQVLVERAVAHAQLDGMVNFDARLGNDGSLALIECNPRPWFTMQLAMLAGRNFAALWFDEALRRRGLAPVERTLPVFPGSLLNGQIATAHLRHMLRDAGYYLRTDAPSRVMAWLRPSNPSLD